MRSRSGRENLPMDEAEVLKRQQHKRSPRHNTTFTRQPRTISFPALAKERFPNEIAVTISVISFSNILSLKLV
jgi:hypothetical protein